MGIYLFEKQNWYYEDNLRRITKLVDWNGQQIETLKQLP